VDTGGGFSEELVDGRLDGEADAAVTARIHSVWFKFRSLIPYLTGKRTR